VLLKKKKKKISLLFFSLFFASSFSRCKSCMHGFFFISSQIYTHTHKVVTECVINTLSVSIYTHIHIYNQIWEPEDDSVKVCFEKAGGLFVREREILFFFFFLFFSSFYT
jgi:hypothetical protein